MTGAATELTVDFEFDRACDSPYVRARRERANSERRRVRVLLVAGERLETRPGQRSPMSPPRVLYKSDENLPIANLHPPARARANRSVQIIYVVFGAAARVRIVRPNRQDIKHDARGSVLRR